MALLSRGPSLGAVLLLTILVGVLPFGGSEEETAEEEPGPLGITGDAALLRPPNPVATAAEGAPPGL